MLLRTDRLRETREQRGVSQRELGRLCGIAETMIHRYETGKTDPSASHLCLMAEKLEVSTDYLLGLTSQPRGQLGDTSLTPDEQEVVDILRRNGWNGVLKLAADRITR
jgi:transcriptional regulator with XRE-family HTH domain